MEDESDAVPNVKNLQDIGKRQSLAAVRQVWSRVERKLRDTGATGEEFDSAIDEVMKHVRRREG